MSGRSQDSEHLPSLPPVPPHCHGGLCPPLWRWSSHTVLRQLVSQGPADSPPGDNKTTQRAPWEPVAPFTGHRAVPTAALRPGRLCHLSACVHAPHEAGARGHRPPGAPMHRQPHVHTLPTQPAHMPALLTRPRYRALPSGAHQGHGLTGRTALGHNRVAGGVSSCVWQVHPQGGAREATGSWRRGTWRRAILTLSSPRCPGTGAQAASVPRRPGTLRAAGRGGLAVTVRTSAPSGQVRRLRQGPASVHAPRHCSCFSTLMERLVFLL